MSKHLYHSLLASCMLILGIVLPASQAQAADGVVGTGTPASCTTAGFTNTLANVMASGGGTLTFNCGAAPHTITIAGYQQIENTALPVVIDGGGTITLDGNNTSPFFQVFSQGNLTLRRIVLQRGAFSGVHALENFGTLTLENATVTQHASTESAIVNYGTMAVRNSTFSNNTITGGASLNGAAIRNEAGAAFIELSTFSENTIPGSIGTGGAIASQSGSVTINASTFTKNRAPDGGAIYLGSSSLITVTQSIFQENEAGYGGAIETAGTRLRVVGSNFDANKTTIGEGGAIWVQAGELVLDQSQFANNQAQTTGGALSCATTLSIVTNSFFGNNQSVGTGGAIHSSCALSVRNSTFVLNRTTGINAGGGAIYHAGAANANAVLVYTTIAENSAAFGAGIYNDGSTGGSLRISRSILTGNTTGNCDGVIISEGYNFSHNMTCGTFVQPSDQQNVTLGLSPLGSYGGPTLTRPPTSGNPAIDHIPAGQCAFATDQRGFVRPRNGSCDSGAVEGSPQWYQNLPLVVR